MGTSDVSPSTSKPTAAWFRAAYPRLHRIACVTAPADVEPDDLVQEALVRLLRRAPGTVEQPEAYAAATIVNLASNERRSFLRRRRAIARVAVDAEPVADVYPSDLTDLDVLSPRARAVLYLHDVEGRSFDQVATLVGMNVVNSRKVAERARAAIHANLEGERL